MSVCAQHDNAQVILQHTYLQIDKNFEIIFWYLNKNVKLKKMEINYKLFRIFYSVRTHIKTKEQMFGA